MPSINYNEYLKSSRWRNMRLAKFNEVGYRCEKCGCEGDAMKIDVHHKTYERLGNERMSDLEVLCRYCHKVKHGEITFDEGGDDSQPF